MTKKIQCFKDGVSLETLAEAMSQLARIGKKKKFDESWESANQGLPTCGY